MIQRRSGKLVFLETFGCQMNELDSQLVTSQLRALGYGFTPDWQQADVLLYNTCSVRDQAENKVRSRLGIVAELKKARPGIVLGVIGCMAERDGSEILRRHPYVDILCGPAELDKLPQLIDNVTRTNRTAIALQGNNSRRSATLAAAEDSLELLDLSRSFSSMEQQGGGRSAYVRITRGCNKFCTYCVVPFTRGAEVHRPPQAIVEECRRLTAAGAREITLLGQTVNHYRFEHGAAVTIKGVMQPQKGRSYAGGHQRDPFGESANVTTFAGLLKRIHDEVPDLPRLRFVTSYPRDFGNDVLEVIRDCPRICRYLHVPAQSGSNRILSRMNRGYTVEEYRDFVTRVREYLPDVQVAGDIIVGFPTETEEDFEATVELVRWARYKNCFVFKYSPRPGTIAHETMEDDVPEETKRRRNNALLRIQTEISKQVHAAQVGRRVSVIVEGISSREGRVSRIAKHAAEHAMQPHRGSHDHDHVQEPGERDACHTAARDTATVALTINGSAARDVLAEFAEDGGEGNMAESPAPDLTARVDREAKRGTGAMVQFSARTTTDLIAVFDAPAEDAERLIGSIVSLQVTGSASLTLFADRVTADHGTIDSAP